MSSRRPRRLEMVCNIQTDCDLSLVLTWQSFRTMMSRQSNEMQVGSYPGLP
jgi:hypothetical protein